jgi:hypothetical protein
MRKKDCSYLAFLVERSVKFLFKDFLYQLEDIADKYSIEEEDFNRIRNRVLDKGNDTIRFFQDQVENYYQVEKIKEKDERNV